MQAKIANLPCLCGSGEKFQRCCGRDKYIDATFDYLYSLLSSGNARGRTAFSELWNEHRQKVHALVAQARESLGVPRCRTAVFGAGNCNDIPLEYLAGVSDKVDLYDIDWNAINNAKNGLEEPLRRKVRCFLLDVTGLFKTVVPRVIAAMEKKDTGALLKALSDFYEKKTRFVSLPRRYDLVLSINVMSQLFTPFMITLGRAASYRNQLPEETFDSYAELVMRIGNEVVPEQHLQFLWSATKGRLVLTTDRYLWGMYEGQETDVKKLVDKPEGLLDPGVQQKLSSRNFQLPGTDIETIYPVYFNCHRKEQWLWTYDQDKTYLIEGYELTPKQLAQKDRR